MPIRCRHRRSAFAGDLAAGRVRYVRVIRAPLTAAWSVTARVQAGARSGTGGNIALSVQVILDWLDSTGRRDSQHGLRS